MGGFTPLQSDALSAVVSDLGATPMQVALAWLATGQASPKSPYDCITKFERLLCGAAIALT